MTAGFVVVTFFDNWVSRAAHSFHNHQFFFFFEGKKKKKKETERKSHLSKRGAIVHLFKLYTILVYKLKWSFYTNCTFINYNLNIFFLKYTIFFFETSKKLLYFLLHS